MTGRWEANPDAVFARRLGKPVAELDPPLSNGRLECPDIWELDNGDVAVVGRDLTESYHSRLPTGLVIGPDTRLVVIPGRLLTSAKTDIPDA